MYRETDSVYEETAITLDNELFGGCVADEAYMGKQAHVSVVETVLGMQVSRLSMVLEIGIHQHCKPCLCKWQTFFLTRAIKSPSRM
jgi:heterodisulfide reductase subunit B